MATIQGNSGGGEPMLHIVSPHCLPSPSPDIARIRRQSRNAKSTSRLHVVHTISIVVSPPRGGDESLPFDNHKNRLTGSNSDAENKRSSASSFPMFPCLSFSLSHILVSSLLLTPPINDDYLLYMQPVHFDNILFCFSSILTC